MTLIKNNADVKEFVPGTFSDLLDNLFTDVVSKTTKGNKFLPRVDVVENEKSYEVDAALPGMNKEDIKIDLQDGKLSISGERKFVNEEKSKTYHSVETQYGSFHRSFYLPEDATSEGIEAEYKDGILKVLIPKDEKKNYKATIQVK
ncbi:MAG TPA: Hsp20/alpha crystallin family protein [Cytophagaceae bacterium]|jgi:HSP20 family protein|nr:Hsp20/alpha crystallin family protein [Cytophagaceae bacterium]